MNQPLHVCLSKTRSVSLYSVSVDSKEKCPWSIILAISVLDPRSLTMNTPMRIICDIPEMKCKFCIACFVRYSVTVNVNTVIQSSHLTGIDANYLSENLSSLHSRPHKSPPSQTSSGLMLMRAVNLWLTSLTLLLGHHWLQLCISLLSIFRLAVFSRRHSTSERFFSSH